MTEAMSLVEVIEAVACIWIVSAAPDPRAAAALRRAGGLVCVSMYLRFAQIQGIAIKRDYETRQIRQLV